MPRGPSSRPKPERLVPPNGRSAPSPAGGLTLAMPTSNCPPPLPPPPPPAPHTSPPAAAPADVPRVGGVGGLVVGAGLVADGGRAEQRLAGGPHVRGHAGEHGRGEVRALAVVEGAADVQRGPLRHRVLHLGEEVLRCL